MEGFEETPIVIEDDGEDTPTRERRDPFVSDENYLDTSMSRQFAQSPLASEAESEISDNQAHIELLEKDSENFKEKLLHAQSMYIRKQRFLAFKTRIKKLKLEKKISTYRADTAELHSFVERMNRWREKNCDQLVQMCRNADCENSGSLEYDTVKLILQDFDVPCSAVELEVLCRLVDTGDDPDTCELPSGYVDYEDFFEPIVAVSNYPDLSLPSLTAFKTLSNVTFYQHTQYQRYVRLWLKFVLFKDVLKCGNHVCVDTTDDVTLHFVAGEVRRLCRLPKYHILFYKSSSPNAPPPSTESPSTEQINSEPSNQTGVALEYGSTLEELGMEGSEQKHDPEEYYLLYDYNVDNYHSALLDEQLLLSEIKGHVVNSTNR